MAAATAIAKSGMTTYSDWTRSRCAHSEVAAFGPTGSIRSEADEGVKGASDIGARSPSAGLRSSTR